VPPTPPAAEVDEVAVAVAAAAGVMYLEKE